MAFLSIVLILIAGFFLGVALNHLADTFPTYRRLLLRPVCVKCGQTFEYSNYILFKGCPECNAKPSFRRKFTPIFMAFFLLAIVFFPPGYTGRGVAIIIFSYMALIFIIDVEHRLILFPLSIFGGILFATVGILINGIVDTLIGGVAGFGILYALYLLGILFSKWMSNRRGEEIEEVALGFGDVSLSFIVGLLVGWPRITMVILFAIILGGVFSAIFLLISLVLKRYKSFTAIPYAPFIIIASIFIIYVSSNTI